MSEVSASSIREQKDDKRRRVFKQALDSPLNVQWPQISQENQQNALNMIESLVKSNGSGERGLGLQFIANLMRKRIREAEQKSDNTTDLQTYAYVVVLLKGSIPTAHLYAWMPTAFLLGKGTGIDATMVVLSDPKAEQRLASHLKIKRLSCITFKILKVPQEDNLPREQELSFLTFAKTLPQPILPWFNSLDIFHQQIHTNSTSSNIHANNNELISSTILYKKWKPLYLPACVQTTEVSNSSLISGQKKSGPRISRQQRKTDRRNRRATHSRQKVNLTNVQKVTATTKTQDRTILD